MSDAQVAESLKFVYNPAPQRSPEWFKAKLGKIGASRMGDWLAVSRAEKTLGKPLKARLDYEQELMFERQFGTSFETFVSGAMQDGIDFEDYACKQFVEVHPEFWAVEVGCWTNDFVTVSPDRLLLKRYPKDAPYEPSLDDAQALLEIKIVKDTTFTAVLMDGVPDKHMKQIQTQLWATGLDKGYYLALNFNTKRFVIIEVERDEELIDFMKEAVQEQLVAEPFKLDHVYEIQGELPKEIELGAPSTTNGESAWQ